MRKARVIMLKVKPKIDQNRVNITKHYKGIKYIPQ